MDQQAARLLPAIRNVAAGIWIAGIEESRAPVAVREALLAATRSAGGPAESLRVGTGLSDAVLLASCRRFEVFAGAAEDRLEWTLRWLESLAGRSLRGMVRVRRGREAARHVFRAAAGLQAWLPWERRAAARVNEAYRAAYFAGTAGPWSHRVFQRARHVARRVRAELEKPGSLGSVGEAAAHLAHRGLGRAPGGSIVVVGTGAAAQDALRHLAGQGVKGWTVCGRASGRARTLASRLGGVAAELSSIPDLLDAVAVALFAVSVDSPMVGAEAARSVMSRRGGRGLLVVDLGVPRSVDAAAGRIAGLRLLDLDGLRRATARKARPLRDELRLAERLIHEESEEF